jgi:hypothetical protein
MNRSTAQPVYARRRGGLVMGFWHGLWLSRGTAADVVSKLNSAVRAALADATVKQRYVDMGQSCRRPSSRRQRRSPRIRKPRSKNGGRSCPSGLSMSPTDPTPDSRPLEFTERVAPDKGRSVTVA